MWTQAKMAMGPRRRIDRRPVAIAMSQYDQIGDRKRGGGAPPPRRPNPVNKYVQLALGSTSLLAGALLSILTGTSAGLIFVPPALFFLGRAFSNIR